VADEPDLHRRALRHALQAAGAASMEELFFDPVTSLPGLPLVVPRIREALGAGKGVGVLALSIAHFSKLEEIYGWETFDGIVRGVASCLKTIKEESLRKEDALAELTINGNVFILVLAPPRANRVLRQRDLARIKVRISRRLDAYLDQVLGGELRHRCSYFVGAAVVRRHPAVRLERQVYSGIDEALTDATTEQEKLLRVRSRQLREIIEAQRIATVYQPIVDTSEGRTIGYEALSRGPAGVFRSPDVLFRVAYETELVVKLERICRERALRGLKWVRPDQAMFINIEPLSIFDPDLATKVPADHVGRIVFEITEHAAISDFSTFRQATQLVKQSGFKLAIDDVGSAYSGLRVISEVEPDFIKLDMELTRGAHANRVKLDLLKAIAGFCTDAQIPMIVEGVETREELDVLGSLGVHLVQGFLFGQPVEVPGTEGGGIPVAAGANRPSLPALEPPRRSAC
jgi:EAL domain-containing protein (putative c-di-GMP-specific phosphodiesterase class I)/GGDEF domain-containing protein